MLPLSDIKVVDISQVFLGPGAAVYMADQGAEVIKVEPLQGEAVRAYHASPYLLEKGFSTPYLALNRNKRGIAIDIRTPEGQEIAHRLAEWADVIILNFRPGDEARFRLDYESLSSINPGLVYAAVSGFGREGPDARLPAYDIVIQARSGVLSTRRAADGTPVPSIINIADMSGCMALAYAIMVALRERDKTGKGQRVDIPLLHTALAMQMQQLLWIEGDNSPLPGQRPSALYSSYQCEDSRWINIVVAEDHQFHGLCRALGLDHLVADPRFATYEQRARMAPELFELLTAIFRTQPIDRWLERLKEEGVPTSEVVERDEVRHDVQTIVNEMLWEQDHPTVGRIKMVAPPFQLSNSRHEPHIRRHAPNIGEHTDEVLAELGYDGTAIMDLRERQVVR